VCIEGGLFIRGFDYSSEMEEKSVQLMYGMIPASRSICDWVVTNSHDWKCQQIELLGKYRSSCQNHPRLDSSLQYHIGSPLHEPIWREVQTHGTAGELELELEST